MATSVLRKIASSFHPRPRKPKRVSPARSRSFTPGFLKPGAPLTAHDDGGDSSTPSSRVTSPKGPFTMLKRLKSWFERHKSLAPEGFFSVDVGVDPEDEGEDQQPAMLTTKKVRYVIPIAYLSHKDLQKLLDDSVVAFGHSYAGPLQLACGEEELQEVLDTIQKSLEGEKGRDAESQSLIPRKHQH